MDHYFSLFRKLLENSLNNFYVEGSLSFLSGLLTSLFLLLSTSDFIHFFVPFSFSLTHFENSTVDFSRKEGAISGRAYCR